MRIINAPKPSRYLKHSTVEELATECNKQYRERQSHEKGYPVNIEAFADLDLEITIVRDHLTEPAFTTVFAKCGEDPRTNGRYVVTINSVYEPLFEKRPDVLRSTIGHEIGHYLLRHHEKYDLGTSLDLFETPREVPFLHDSSWKPLAFTKDDMNEWFRRAFKGDEDAQALLAQLKDRMEPDWMFWQAEHFSMCLLIPRDRILGLVNNGCEVSSWFAIGRLAAIFGVSLSMMRVRLTKMGVISIENGKPKVGPLLQQPNIFARIDCSE